MSTTTIQPTTGSACPAWCTDHLESDGSWIGHTRRVAVGNVAVVIEWCPTDESTEGQPVIPVDDYQWVNGQEARDYAAAIVAACDLIEGDRASARIARRVSAILTAEPIDPDQLEAIATALGVDLLDLVRPDSDSAPGDAIAAT